MSILIRLRRRLDGWRRDQTGSIAVEVACIAPLLALGAASMMNLKMAAQMHADMGDSLRIASQHILDGGTDLARVEALFKANYGRTPQTFNKALVCACSPQYSSDTSDEEQPKSDEFAQTTNRSQNLDNTDEEWYKCNNSCQGGEEPMSFVEFLVTDTAPKPLVGEQPLLHAKLLVRVVEELQ